jgi:hypothetical protein
MKLAAGGDIKVYFDGHPELADLVSLHLLYVKEWVRVFYATVYIADTREYIMFMFHRTNILFSDTILLPLLD